MKYFNYHGIAKGLISRGMLTGWYIADNYNGISPALVLIFNDIRHPIMPIRQSRWSEYEELLPKNLKK